MSFSSLIKKQNIALGFTAAERDPTDFMDVVESSFNMTQLNYNLDAQAHAQREASLDALRKVKELGLQEIYEQYRGEEAPKGRANQKARMPRLTDDINWVPEVFERTAIPSATKEAHDKAVLRGRQENPEVWNQIPTSSEIDENARSNAKLSLEEAEEVSRYASGFDSTVGGFVGGLGGAATDPVNIATMFIGAGAGKSILQATAIEAAANAGVEATLQPTIMDWQKELEQEYGFSDAAISILTAGIFGGAMVPAKAAAKYTVRQVFDAIANSKLFPAEARHAAAALERNEHIREADPAGSATKEDEALHFENVKRTAEAMESGRPIRADEIYVSAIVPKTKAAREFLGLNEEIAKLKLKEVDKIKAELTSLAGNVLSRGERKLLRQEIRDLKFRLEQIDDTIDESKLRQPRENISAKKAEKEKKRQIIERKKAEDEAKKLAGQERANIQEKIDIGEQRLKDNDQYLEAKGDLTRLEQGIVPERYADRVNRAAEGVQVEPVARMPEAEKIEAQKELVDQGVLDEPEVPRNVYDELMEEANSDESLAAMEADFMRMLKDNPDKAITTDGQTQKTLQQIADEMDEEQAAIDAMRTCAVRDSDVF